MVTSQNTLESPDTVTHAPGPGHTHVSLPRDTHAHACVPWEDGTQRCDEEARTMRGFPGGSQRFLDRTQCVTGALARRPDLMTACVVNVWDRELIRDILRTPWNNKEREIAHLE